MIKNGQTLSCLTGACLLVAGCAAMGDQSSPMASRTNPDDASAPARVEAAEARATPGTPPVDPSSLQRRREAIARTLEASIYFRPLLLDDGAAKLVDAKFAGPFEYNGGLFGHRETVYCASAKLVLWPIADWKTAVIRVDVPQPGQERFQTKIGLNHTPSECLLAKYGPFPELEIARHKRREALGKAD